MGNDVVGSSFTLVDCRENSSLTIAITQRTCGATKRNITLLKNSTDPNTLSVLSKRTRNEKVQGRLRGHKKVPRCCQQVPGRKALEEDGPKKEVKPADYSHTQSDKDRQ
ncbi:hypothetical protein Trydic_g22913 [Trypoxylus dichotomus]